MGTLVSSLIKMWSAQKQKNTVSSQAICRLLEASLQGNIIEKKGTVSNSTERRVCLLANAEK